MEGKQFFYEFGKLLYKVDSFYSECAKSFGVKENLLWVLYALNDGDEHSQTEISTSWDIPKSTVNTIIKELEKKQYVKLEQIKGEKRELNILLTNSGKHFANKLLKNVYEMEKNVFTNLSDNAKQINTHLTEILKLLNKERRNGKNE